MLGSVGVAVAAFRSAQDTITRSGTLIMLGSVVC